MGLSHLYPSQVSPKRSRKRHRALLGGRKCARFPEKNANLPHRACFISLQGESEGPKCGSGCKWDLGAQGRNAKAPARNNAPGGSMAHATRAWRKHALPNSETFIVKYRQSRKDAPKWPFWKHRAPKMRLVEARCAYRKHCYPETPLGSPPTSGVVNLHPLN